MKKFLLPLVFILLTYQLTAQSPDWSTTIAPIIYNNCSSCHHQGTVAPFPLMNYQDVVSNSIDIMDQVNNRFMPPWPPDPAYRHFAYEAMLDSLEIVAINDWIIAGMPLGDTLLAPAPPVFPASGSILDTIHFVAQIPPYTLQYNTDEYRYFAMHTGFTDTVYVSKIEVIPGLPELVHHADIHYDLTGTSFYNDSISPIPGFSGGMVSNYYMNAWQVGGNIVEYPDNWGIMVPPGADFVFEIHYGPGGQGMTDSTKMNLRFITTGGNVRPIHVGWLLNGPIGGPLVIPPNVITTFDQMSQPMPVDRSLISICPHMHKLGSSYKVWYKDLNQDSVPLIDIPHWDFHWQKYFMFQQIQKIPAGARIFSTASYDNTINNPHNPNNPPITVYNGPTTNDEMLMTYFIWANYQPGDENIVLDSTLTTSLPPGNQIQDEFQITVYPNPASDYIYVKAFLNSVCHEVKIFNMLGAEVKKITVGKKELLERIDLKGFSPGIYFIQVTADTFTECRKIVVRE